MSDVPRSRRCYSQVLGGTVALMAHPCTVRLATARIIINPGGGSTPDKPDVALRPPEGEPDTVETFRNLRVADLHAVCAPPGVRTG